MKLQRLVPLAVFAAIGVGSCITNVVIWTAALLGPTGIARVSVNSMGEGWLELVMWSIGTVAGIVTVIMVGTLERFE